MVFYHFYLVKHPLFSNVNRTYAFGLDTDDNEIL
jgi:hypothetical protein